MTHQGIHNDFDRAGPQHGTCTSIVRIVFILLRGGFPLPTIIHKAGLQLVETMHKILFRHPNSRNNRYMWWLHVLNRNTDSSSSNGRRKAILFSPSGGMRVTFYYRKTHFDHSLAISVGDSAALLTPSYITEARMRSVRTSDSNYNSIALAIFWSMERRYASTIRTYLQI